MPFSAVSRRTYDETRKRTSTEYVKFTPKHRTVLRMLDLEALEVWKHWIPQANKGKGMGAVCPNITPQLKVCPIDLKYADLPKDNEERKANNARRKFVINVLDRTPHTTCKFCQTVTPPVTLPGSSSKKCISCDADLKGHDFKPLNRIKILEQGPKLFNENLNAIDDMQKSDLGLEITEYDITFTTQGEGRERRITAIPQEAKELEEDALLDEDGEPQRKFDLSLLAEPTSIEEIELMMEGATMDQLNAIRGIV